MTTPLESFMNEKRWTDVKMAGEVGCERSTITKLRLGQARPSLDLAIKIAAVTNNRVPATAYPKPKSPTGNDRPRRRLQRAEAAS